MFGRIGGRILVSEKLKRLVAFAVLMEKHEGILMKAPYYVLEKFELAMGQPVDLLTQLMDNENKAKYEEYLKRWKI